MPFVNMLTLNAVDLHLEVETPSGTFSLGVKGNEPMESVKQKIFEQTGGCVSREVGWRGSRSD